ncbi:MAG: dihydropteroate synthase [Actinomycetota bacterium]|nr:dihydropteroate synthase [Actinomycetota bacterium]MDH5223158.1 dihydropteroate synthase [Actinomycetota bacterium]MDH5312210.1 dihydropteroate synthase [Actinomycetota bacterium]
MSEAVWRCRDHTFPLGERTLVMGIVNVTPDSFSDGGALPSSQDAIAYGLRLAADGAHIVDVGGESTRPGAEAVPIEDELARVVPVIEGLREAAPSGVVLSVDTRRPDVARAALDAGASIVNDVTAAASPGMFDLVRASGAGLVLMHMLGEPRTMQDDPRYDDVVTDVRDFLAARLGAAVAAGVRRDHLCVDPGIGFGKNLDHNLSLLHDIASFAELRVPVLVGASRKRFIGQLTGVDDPAERVEGTAGAVAWCAANGVDIVRVHDVLEMTRVVRVVDAISRGVAS